MLRANLIFESEFNTTKKRFRKTFERKTQGIGAQVANELQPTVLKLFDEPGPVVYPIVWRSERQRRAFFATNGFGRGIPTERKGKVNKAWKVIYVATDPGSGVIEINNPVPYARYVYGSFTEGNTFQQPFHRNTGWNSARMVRGRVMALAKSRIISRFRESLGDFGSVYVRIAA